VFERTTCVRTHQLFVVERRAQVRPQITAAAARAESGVRSNARKCGRTQITTRAGCRLHAACDVVLCCMRRASMVLHAACDCGAAGCVGAFESTKCSRTHYGRIFTLSPLSCPLLAMFVAMTCTTQNAKNYTKY
jgi:hypothetical protein